MDYGRVAYPVYAVGGWADGYSELILHVLANLDPMSDLGQGWLVSRYA